MFARTPISWLHDREARTRTWEAASPQRRRRSYFKCFTAVFALFALALVAIYLSGGREPIWANDGIDQYYPFFVYEGEWLRDAIGGLLTGQGWHPALWSWSVGYGSDTLATLDVFWDPLNLLSALFPARFAEFMFCFLILVRMYLAGVTFSLYALHRGNGRFATLCGALVYCLAAPALIGLFWPGGVDPLILFPLLLLGAEKVLDGGRPTVFIVATALFFLVSYYFAYAACLFLLFYCLVRVFVVEQHMTVARFFAWVGKFAGFLIVGVLIAGAALVPSAMQLLGETRATSALAQIPLLYSPNYYGTAIGGFLGTANVGSDCYIGFSGAAFLCCVLLFLRRKSETRLKVTLAVLTVFLLLPFFGSLFNGFNYATNRWVWAYDMCIAYIIVRTVPQLERPSQHERNALFAAMTVYALVILFDNAARTEAVVAAFAAMTALAAGVLATQNAPELNRRSLMVTLICIGLFVNAFYFSSSAEKGYADNSEPVGAVFAKTTADSPNSLVAALNDSSWWRYDADPAQVSSNNGSWVRVYNDSTVLGLNGIDFYNSIYNNDIDRYHTELGIAADDVNFMYANLGGRTMLETLANVKYYVLPTSYGQTPPYNYNQTLINSGSVRGNTCLVYQGSNTLPLGFTYGKTIARSTYDALTPLQKQEALMQGMVVSDATAATSDVSSTTPDSTDTTVASSVVSANGVTVEDGALVVNRANATLTLSVAGLTNSETYLSFTNLDYEGLTPLQLTSQSTYDALSWYRRAELVANSLSYSAPNTYLIYASSDKGSAARAIVNSNKTWHMYGGKSNWDLNLGYSTEAQTTVTLTFSAAGRYTYDDMSVVCQPMDQVNDQVDALKADTLENTVVGTDCVGGTISLAEPKYLYFSIPYSSGWSATVDGEPATIEKANTAFMALDLPAGDHTVELTYCTPGLKVGGALTLLGLVLFTGIIIGYRRRDKRDSL